MNAIRNVFNAFSNLAASVNALASVIDVATGRRHLHVAYVLVVPAVLRGSNGPPAIPRATHLPSP
jgi:hypothetical protein